MVGHHHRKHRDRPALPGRLHQVRPRADPVLPDDIEWTLVGGYHLTGKAAYDAEIENPAFSGSPVLRIVRLVEQDDVVMGELVGEVHTADGEPLRLAMAETWVMRDGLLCERRSYVVALKESDYR